MCEYWSLTHFPAILTSLLYICELCDFHVILRLFQTDRSETAIPSSVWENHGQPLGLRWVFPIDKPSIFSPTCMFVGLSPLSNHVYIYM